MGVVAKALRSVRNVAPSSGAPLSVSNFQHGRAQLPDSSYQTYALEGYAKNELVYACIEELATSAAEPRMHLREGGEWMLEHPLIDLFKRPNPFMDGFSFWATVIMYLNIAGNAYALKVRSQSSKWVQTWLIRPDRVRVVADQQKFIRHYEVVGEGGETFEVAVEDMIHWKKRNPVSEFYGMPPLMAAAGRVDIDNYMKDFVKSFFQSAGVPAGVLSLKSKVDAETKKEIKEKWRHDYGGPAGWHELLILDQNDATFTSMTSNLGPSGLVVPSLDEMNEARICMVFGVPVSLVGARLGVNSSSYANKRSDRESFWDETLSPLYKALAGPVNNQLPRDFPRVKEIQFDLSDVRALRQDVDAVHQRARNDLISGGISIEEFRKITAQPEEMEGTFLIPSNLVAVQASAIKAGTVTTLPEKAPATEVGA